MTGYFSKLYRKYQKNDFFHFRYTGRGIYNDIKVRLIPYYFSDLKDGIDYRVIPATIYVFFTNLLPAIAFAQDMFDHTNNSYGLNEILMSSSMGGIVFGLFAGQPLCIVGVTGPVSIFNYTVYELIVPRGIPYFPFMCWICLWSCLLHIVIAFGNLVNFMRIITKYSCDVFGLFINVVYIQKGIQILSNQFAKDGVTSGFASVTVALSMGLFGCACSFFGTKTFYIKPVVRKFFADYGTPLCVVFFTGFIHFGGYLDDVNFARLPTTKSFHPTSLDRPDDWFIRFWEGVSVGDVFLALPFGILLTALFYFDHNIASLICQGSEFPLTKPASFHYDFLLLGITTGVSGLLGIPAPNGLIPQAPLHTESLCVYEHDYKTGKDKIVRVVEQRITNTVQGLMTLGLMSGPLLVVLGQIPQAVLSGLFWIMAITALNENEIVNRLRYLITDKDSINNGILKYPEYYNKLNKKWFILFVIFELIAFGFEFGITLTKGAVGFPGVLLFFMIFATFFPSIFPKDQLDLLDSPAVEELILRNLKVEPTLQKESAEANRDDANDESYSLEDLEVCEDFVLCEDPEHCESNSHLTNRCRQIYRKVGTVTAQTFIN